MIFRAALLRPFLRQPDIKRVISIRPLRLIVPETDAKNFAGPSYVVPEE
jgi:hypothetical protein